MISIIAWSRAPSSLLLSGPESKYLTSFGVSALPRGSVGNSGGVTSLVEAGLR